MHNEWETGCSKDKRARRNREKDRGYDRGKQMKQTQERPRKLESSKRRRTTVRHGEPAQRARTGGRWYGLAKAKV
ncbi:hypothetical protein FA13DRAFT_1735696, partial [Coprinellus micaceus]